VLKLRYLVYIRLAEKGRCPPTLNVDGRQLSLGEKKRRLQQPDLMTV
jgi:hypothetical protein